MLALVVLAGAAALIVPAIDSSKERAAAADAREAAQRRAESRRAARSPSSARARLDAPALRPASGAPAAQRIAARDRAARSAPRRAISEDARARARRRASCRAARRARECEPYPKRDRGDGPSATSRRPAASTTASSSCAPIASTETNVGGQLGYPFRAVLDFDGFSVTWCKTNPVPGERVVPDPRTVIELPPGLPRAPERASRRTGHRGERPSSDGFPQP